jgi:NAD(P)-dependent dehydrogenase (short-subunit alcohol dehydrogenase family)
MSRVLVTGAGRGLGLEFVKQCLQRGDQVFAGVRTPARATELQTLRGEYPETLTLLPLDVTDPTSLQTCHQMVSSQVDGLDLLVNNAGVNSKSPGVGDFATHFRLEDLDADNVLGMFRINSLGPMMMVQQFLDLLKAGVAAKVINISSWLGSLTDKTGGGNYSYCASKTALNMLTRTMAFDVVEHGIIAVMVNPGWVQTDMGGPNARLTPSQSVQSILAVADKLTPADAGGFFDWNGETHPW